VQRYVKPGSPPSVKPPRPCPALGAEIALLPAVMRVRGAFLPVSHPMLAGHSDRKLRSSKIRAAAKVACTVVKEWIPRCWMSWLPQRIP
jgi:hypothetical protein